MQMTALSEVGLLNMNFLTALQALALRDPMAASYTFGLNAEEVAAIAQLSVDALQKLALSVDRSMFQLRPSVDELCQLAAMPGPLAWLVNALGAGPIPITAS